MNARSARGRMLQSLLLGGIIPVVAFSVIEDRYGTMWGLVAGMVFGAGEIAYEALTQRRVDPMTWGGNGLLLILGGVSLFTQEGIWFKLQPSLIEAAMAVALWVSVALGKPLLVSALEKQLAIQSRGAPPMQAGAGLPGAEPPPRPTVAPPVAKELRGMTIRLGIFFALHAALAAWAALHWSTNAWAALKGIGFTFTMIGYMAVEGWWLRVKVAGRSASLGQR